MSQFFIDPEISSKERFDTSKLLEFDVDGFDVLNSTFLEDVKKLKKRGVYVVTSEEGKPDLLSFRIYGSTQYWWILLFYNNIATSDDLLNNITIEYPSLNKLEDLFFSLRAKQVASNR